MLMEKGLSNTPIIANMKDIGKMVYDMDSERIHCLIRVYMSACIKVDLDMERGQKFFQMEKSIQAIGNMV